MFPIQIKSNFSFPPRDSFVDKRETMTISYDAVISEESTLIPVVAPVSTPVTRRYRGGFHTSICDIFRNPHRRTDCCAVACCGILSSDRSLYLLTGERPPPLWKRVLMYIVIPALLLAASNYFAVDVTIEDEDGQSQTYKEPSAKLLLALIGYVILIICLGFGVSSRHISIA